MAELQIQCPNCEKDVPIEESTHSILNISWQAGLLLALEATCQPCKRAFRVTWDSAGQYVSYLSGEENVLPPMPVVHSLYEEFTKSSRVVGYLFNRFKKRKKVLDDDQLGIVQIMARDGRHPANSDQRFQVGTGIISRAAADELIAEGKTPDPKRQERW